LLDFLVVVTGPDGDPARLHCLRHLPDQVDLQQTGIEGSPLHLDVIGEVENPPERTGRDPLVEILVLGLFGFPAFHGEDILFSRYGDLIRCKAGERQRYLVMIIADPRNIVWRVNGPPPPSGPIRR
jgi:hypothetical protein